MQNVTKIFKTRFFVDQQLSSEARLIFKYECLLVRILSTAVSYTPYSRNYV